MTGFLGRSAPDLHALRFRRRGGRPRVRASSSGSVGSSSAPEVEGVFTLFAIALHGRRASSRRPGDRRRVRRTDLPGSAAPPALLVRREYGAPPAERAGRRRPGGACERRRTSAHPRLRLLRSGLRCLSMLLGRGEKVVGCLHARRRAGPGGWPPSLVPTRAAHGIPAWTARAVERRGDLPRAALAPDLIFSFYYRDLLPREPCSRCPGSARSTCTARSCRSYRGRAPVNWAVLEGEKETGATLHLMVEKADAGAIVDQERVAIGPRRHGLRRPETGLPKPR